MSLHNAHPITDAVAEYQRATENATKFDKTFDQICKDSGIPKDFIKMMREDMLRNAGVSFEAP